VFDSDLQLEIVDRFIKTGLLPVRSCDKLLAYSQRDISLNSISVLNLMGIG
jgi:hypothetical protein